MLLPRSKLVNRLELISGCVVLWRKRFMFRAKEQTTPPIVPLNHHSCKMDRKTE